MVRWLWLLLFICSLMPAMAQIQNLLPNGDFESGSLTGWAAGNATASTAQAHSGSWSARTTTGQMEAIVATAPGTTYKCTAWIRITTESGNDWGGLTISAVDQGWTSLATSGFLLTANRGSAWFKEAVTFTALSAQTRLQIGYFGGAGRSMIVHVDDILVFRRQSNNTPPDVTCSLDPQTISVLPAAQNFAVTGDDPDGTIARVEWDFGDGTKALAASGTRPVTTPGSATATVRVADDDGAVTVRTVSWNAIGSGVPILTISEPAGARVDVAVPEAHLSGTISGGSVRYSTDRGCVGTATGTTSWAATVPLLPGVNRVLMQAHGGSGTVVTSEKTFLYTPATSIAVSNVSLTPAAPLQWDPLEITFVIQGSAATHPQFPYAPSPAPGLTWVDGISVDGEFTNNNWTTILRRPAFLYQRYTRALKSNEEWMYPSGEPVWCVRFSPPASGQWKYRLRVAEKKGNFLSPEFDFSVNAPGANDHGPIDVSPQDSRYFRHADGTTFLGSGHGIGFGDDKFSYDASTTFSTIGDGNQNLFRWWIAGQLWGSAWQPWASRTLGYDATVPATALSLESAYGDGYASFKLDAANPILFQGFSTGHAATIPGRTYIVRIRWRTESVTGPAVAGQPYGVCVKRTGWPEVGQTGSIPVTVAHVAGSSPWHVATGTFVASGDLLPNLAIILENCTGGKAFVDECAMHEVLPDGTLGPQLLRSPRAMSVYTFDPRRGAGIDRILLDAAARSMAFKMVISEKQEFLLNHLGPEGLPDANAVHFNNGPGSPTERLHEYYWRHLFARFGAYRSVHSWELVNEEAPGPGAHFKLTARLAALASLDGNPHLATTSTWATLAETAWKDPASAPIGYVDFHAYVRGTGWLEPKDSLVNDAAGLFLAYDAAARAAGFGKPVVWGEMGIDGTGGTDGQDPALAMDGSGIWLHKIIWARCAPGGVYPLYWYTDNIFAKNLHSQYGRWHTFMKDVPLALGSYVDAGAISSSPDLRVVGQKNLARGHAYLWLDNRRNTWRRGVDGVPVTLVSGNVTVNLGAPGKTYPLRWFDTWSGIVTSTGTATADASGNIVLPVSSLALDMAVHIGGEKPTSAQTPQVSQPREFRLGQNYPNPFNPSTQIPFELPERGIVHMKVFDILGREVAILVNGVMDAGKHSAGFDGSHLSSGNYIVRLLAGGDVMTARMMLVK